MVRWRCCLFLAMLFVLPVRASPKLDDEEEESDKETQRSNPSARVNYLRKTFPPRRAEENEDDDDDDDDDDEEPQPEKMEQRSPGRRAPAEVPPVSSEPITRTTPRRPLECYVCAYKAETQLRSCLDPTKFRVHTMICHSPEDKCFTSVISKGNTYEAVMRGCRSGCVGTPETTCCELNRCNNQALAVPVAAPHILTQSKASKASSPSVLFFVTILLVLQTVVKVAIIL